ncbi:MAG: hypothetical protein KJP21_04095 [Bacteroidia bacterium]|nr:hypothetical protein [Bacteroidia bacterium]NNJ54759.1 hypothetical protein [Bacteroidia bacterium]
MEREKTKIIELPELEKEILDMCIFQESFESIADECVKEKNRNIIADAIKNLIHYKLLIPTNQDNSLTWVYDSDKMKDSSFKATAAGISWMELNS